MSNQLSGKKPNFLREVNNSIVISYLKKAPCSGTELSETMHLSNATLSSILGNLLDRGIIKIAETSSVKGCGRKRVMYTIDESFGLILAIDISNYFVNIVLSNLRSDIIFSKSLEIDRYNRESLRNVILEAASLVLNHNEAKLPLKTIVISMPGRVNINDGSLLLSVQFDEDLFLESDYIRNEFKHTFENVPVYIANDIKLSAYAEMESGQLAGVNNALYISVDTGIGGAVINNGKIFYGDQGYSGEFGLLPVSLEPNPIYLDDVASLRVLCEKASKKVGYRVGRTKLIALCEEDEEIKAMVRSSASTLGKCIRSLITIFDVSTIVLSGRIVGFGDFYREAVEAELKNLLYPPKVIYSQIQGKAKIMGAIETGINHILNDANGAK